MGISPSKRVSKTLSNSPDFTSTCTSVYRDCLTLAQHAFPGVQPYQLSHATSLLHHSLSSSSSHPLLNRWLSTPPARPRVDQAYRSVIARRNRSGTEPADGEEEEQWLGPAEFREFALEVLTGGVLDNATAAVVKRVPIGVVGIVVVGVGVRAGKDLVGTLIGVYSVGVAASVYLSLLSAG